MTRTTWEACVAVGDGPRPRQHAVDEVLGFDPKRLVEIDEGGDDVAVPVVELELAKAVGRLQCHHALVIDLDLLIRLDVVVGDHLLAFPPP